MIRAAWSNPPPVSFAPCAQSRTRATIGLVMRTLAQGWCSQFHARSRRGTTFWLLLAVMLGLADQAWAQTSEQVPIGPRAIAMGSAYTSLAQDASALFWNPAGLAGIEHQEIAASYADLYQSGVRDNVAAFVLPFSR